MNSSPAVILKENLAIAGRMLGHLERSYHLVAPSLPIQPEQIPGLGNDTIDRLDLYLARFGKLQDFLVSKLFRSIAIASLADTSQDVSLLDTLGRMEKYGVVESLDSWLQMRLLRNSLTHEYLTSEEEIVENINGAFSHYTTLEKALQRANDYTAKHIT